MMLYVYALKIIRRVMAERSSAEENRLKKLKSNIKRMTCDCCRKSSSYVYPLICPSQRPVASKDQQFSDRPEAGH